jgi:farnesyl-diphosphate farnesyltransferase
MLPLLRRVSRSFYLSVRLLPEGLRRPVAVAYLLARTSDTIADVPGCPAAERLRLLDAFESSLHSLAPGAALPAAMGVDEGERALLAAFPSCLAWLRDLPPDDRDDVFGVLRHITRGQQLDVQRFGDADAAHPHALADEAELTAYTYLVAGCVGEFWTRLSFRHVPAFAGLGEPEMLDLGRRYGEALQLINILRDARRDLEQGRRYVPDGSNPQEWLARAWDGLECGLRYSLAVRSARLGVATALPALIGVRTLALMRRTPGAPVKVARTEVRALLWRLALSLGSRSRIRREFSGWDNPPK